MKIFVGCSASNNLDEKYYKLANELATRLAFGKNELIYGSGSNGMMGIFYNAFNKNKCKVTSIVPKIYKDSIKKLKLDEIIYVETTDQEINYLVRNGDITIFLPGGFGVLTEILMCIYTRRANEHNRPLIILNAFNFYDDLLNMFDKIYEEKFSSELPRDIHVVDSIEEVMELLEKYK